MIQLAFIFIGGGCGASLRYGFHLMFGAHASYWTTLLSNGLGCFLMGLAFVLLPQYLSNDPQLQRAITIGFLGALTTFSAFSYDAYQLWINGDTLSSAAYIIGSVVVALGTFILGVSLSTHMVQ